MTDLPRPLPIHGDPCQSLAAENARLRRQRDEARDEITRLLHRLTRAERDRLTPAGIRQPGPLLAVHTSDGRVYHPADVSFQYLDGPSSSPADAPSDRAEGDPIPDTAQTRSAGVLPEPKPEPDGTVGYEIVARTLHRDDLAQLVSGPVVASAVSIVSTLAEAVDDLRRVLTPAEREG